MQRGRPTGRPSGSEGRSTSTTSWRGPGPTLRADTALLDRWRQRTRVLFVDEAQDLDRTQLDLALLLTGERRDIFLVGDDDQTIYAWRLADVRRVLGLAALLPGLRRVDLEVNHRCPPEVVRRAARLVAHGRERFDKRILPSPRSSGTLTLAADPGDEVARARHLLTSWQRDGAAGHAVLARTNAQLAPYAAIALELGPALPRRGRRAAARRPRCRGDVGAGGGDGATR